MPSFTTTNLSRCSVRGFRLFVAVAASIASAQIANAQQAMDVETLQQSRLTGHATFVTGNQGSAIPVRVPLGQARPTPIDFLKQRGDLFGIADATKQLRETRVRTDTLGQTHTTYEQVQNGVKVFGAVLKVHQNMRGEIIAANGDFFPMPTNFQTVPTLTAKEAGDAAVQAQKVGNPTVHQAELTIVDPGWYGSTPLGTHLAYYVTVTDLAVPLHEAMFIDAHTSAILDRWSLIETARDRRIHDGLGGAGLPGSPARFEGQSAVVAPVDVNRAYDYFGDTYDYYFRAFGRDSLDGLGLPLVATVNSTAPTCPNAFWSGFLQQMVFCTGTVTDDIVGHELQHGVTSTTAGLIYQWQSGQLSESYSDIFGEMIDLYNGDVSNPGPPGVAPFWPPHATGPGQDTPNNLRTSCSSAPNNYPDGVRWLLGEDAAAFGGAIRDMAFPMCDNDPDRANHPRQVCALGDNGGVHSGSGIPNHAFMIMTDGKTFNGYTVNGIGPIKSGAIWYRALATYMTPISDFEDTFFSVMQSAQDLVGTNPNDPRTGAPSASAITLADVDEVEKALLATEMNTLGLCGARDRVMTSAPAPTCPGRTVFFADDFESGAATWLIGITSAPPTVYFWNLVSALPFTRPGTAFFIEDRNIGDCAGQDESAVHLLISPAIAIPAGVTTPMVSFTHYMRSEGRYDGGRVSISVNAGSFQPIPRTAFTYNPYNSMLDTVVQANTNPLAGAEAWSGIGGQWGTSIVNLSALVTGGDTIKLQFEFGKDGCTGLTGWYLDDLEVYECDDCDNNGTPDTLEHRFAFASPILSNIGDLSPQSFTIVSPPTSGSDVTLSFTGMGDFLSNSEFVRVKLNGTNIGILFNQSETAFDCATDPESETITIDAATFNSLVAGGNAVFDMVATVDVDPLLCAGASYITAFVQYESTESALPDPLAASKSRYFSAKVGNAGRNTALRVTFRDLPAPFDVFNGEVRWVGQPDEISENSGLTDTTPPTMWRAQLSCTPVLFDWGSVGTIHVYGEDIVSDGVYEIEVLEEACGSVLEATALPRLTVLMNTWSDIVAPEDIVDFTDIQKLVEKFKNTTNAISKAATDIAPAIPDGLVDFDDIQKAIEAFKGASYPYDSSAANITPCP